MAKIMTPNYSTMTFNNIYVDAESFIKDFNNNGIKPTITQANAELTFYLLSAKYGNNPIANRDINQFKNKIFAIMFQFGPTWEKRLEIQSKIRNLSDDELMSGSKQIYNHAFNDAGEPTEQSMMELKYINDQNTTNNKRSKLDAYAFVWDLLKVDVTEGYVRQFRNLFKQFVEHEQPTLYTDDECESEVVDIYGN